MRLLAALILWSVACSPVFAAPVQITVWEEEQPDIQHVLDQAFTDFNKAHPAIQVRRSHYNTEDLRVQFQTAAMARTGPEVVLAPNDFAGVFSVMGLIEPVESWGHMERFADPAVVAITDAQKHSWGLPINLGNYLILYVNRALVSKVPETVEELVAVGKAATKADKKQFGLAYSAQEPFWFVPFLSLWGERPLVSGKPNIGNAAMVNALALVRGFKSTDKITPEDCDYHCAETLFKERRAAMTINGDWAVKPYAESLGKDLAIAPLPRLQATGRWMEPMVSGKYLMIRQGLVPAQLAAAKTFVESMVTPETQAFLAAKGKRLPSLKVQLEGDLVKQDPLLAASRAAMAHSQPMPMDVQMRAVWDAIRPQLQAVMAGRAEPKAAAARMQADATAKISDMAH